MIPTLPELAEKYEIIENSSMIIVQRGSSKEGPFLCSEYDSTYPRPAYRGRVNLLGGAQEFEIIKTPGGKRLRVSLKDINPAGTMRREIAEEVKNVGNKKGFTRNSTISGLRKEMQRNLKDYADYFAVTPVPPRTDGSGRFDYVSIDSAFVSEINPELFDEIQYVIKRGKRIVSEGNLAVVSLDELMSGKRLFAWDSGIILGDYIGTSLPNPEGVIALKMRTPLRELYSQYRKDPQLRYAPLNKRP